MGRVGFPTYLFIREVRVAITCRVNFSARFTKFIANVSLVLSDPIATTCCVNFSARFTKFIANVSLY